MGVPVNAREVLRVIRENEPWWVDASRIRKELREKGIEFNNIKVGQLARVLYMEGLIERRRRHTVLPIYEYKGKPLFNVRRFWTS